MVRTARTFFTSALLFMASGLAAQNSVDITAVPGQNNDIEVRVRFENDFDGYFAASVFTIRWNEASGAGLGSVQQDAQVQEYHDVNPSGPVETSNGYRYQVFAGFGGSVLSDIPLTLMAGQWITLCTIPVVNGSDVFTIVNDVFTATVNGDYYVSLGGQESQGDIIEFNTALVASAAAEQRFNAFPTTTSDQITVDVDLGDAELVGLSLMNAAGEELWANALFGLRGPQRRIIDLSSFCSGTYVVRLRMLEGERVARVVKR